MQFVQLTADAEHHVSQRKEEHHPGQNSGPIKRGEISADAAFESEVGLPKIQQRVRLVRKLTEEHR